MNENQNRLKEVDFSKYRSSTKNGLRPQTQPSKKFLFKRVWYFVFVLIILLGLQTYLIFKNKTQPTMPAGYRVITPKGQPTYLEPIK